MADGRVIVLVNADTSGYDKALSQLPSTTEKQATKAGSSIANVAGKLSSFGAAYTKAVTVPIAGAAAASVVAAVKIDTSLTNVRKTVDGTEEQYQQLKTAAIEFSKTNAVSASQILDIQSLGAQLGYSIDELEKFGEVASGLDIATDMDADTAATEMAQFANITRMAHGDIDKYASSIVNVGNNMATTESKVSHMAQRIAAAGTQVKMSQADIIGWSGAMASLGIEAEAGGTAFSMTISTIDAAVAKGGKGLDKFAKIAGMSSKEFSEAWKKSASDTLISMLKGVDGAENMTIALEEMGVTGLRQTDVLKRLSGNTDLVSKALDIANQGWNENVALTNEVENRNNSLAAKFEMLKNKGIAMLEQFGTPLADALLDIADAAEPVISAVADMAQSFADADKGTQQAILGAVAFVAAIGPVTSVSGKVLGVVGKLNGGITKLGSGFKNLIKDSQPTTTAFMKYTTQATRGNSAIVKWDKSTQSYVKTNSKVARALAETTTGTKLQTVAQTTANATMKVGSTVARGLGSALKTIAPIAILSAVIGIIGAVSTAMNDAEQKARTYEQATTGLANSMNAMNEVDVSGFTQAAGEIAGAGEGVKKSYDDIIQAQASFATKSTETWGNINGQSAAVSAFAETIADLTSKESLNADEQAKLSAAVAGYNQITGENVKITDLAKGKLDTSTASILENAEAWKYNAEMQALQQELVELYTQLHDAQNNLATAQANVAQAQADYDEALKNGSTDLASYKAVLDNAKQGEIDAQAAVDRTNQAIDARVDKCGEVALAQQGTSQAIQEFIANNQELQDKLNGTDFQAFSDKLAQLGFDTATLNQMGTENIQALAHNFNGNLDTIISNCEKAGIEIPGKLSDGIYKGSGGVSFAAGSLAAQVYGELTGQDYTQTGVFVTQGMAQGIDKGKWEAALKAQGMGDETIKALNEALGVASPSTKASSAGGYVGLGLAQGLSGDTSANSAASTMGANVIASLTASLEGAGQIGTDTGTSFSTALEGTGEIVLGAAQFVGSQAQVGMTDYEAFATIGTTSGGRFGTAVGDTAGSGRLKGNAVASATKAGMTIFDAFFSVGSTSGGNYASGVGSRSGDAKSAGQSDADAARDGMKQHNDSSDTWGSHLVQNFAAGIRAGLGWVGNAARAIADKAKSILGFSVPKKGPWAGAERGGERSGEHLVQNFAAGMTSAIPELIKASNSLANTLYRTLSNLDAPSIPVDARIETANLSNRLSDILGSVSVAGIISGSVSIDALSKRLESIESKMSDIEARLESIDHGINKLNATLKEPVDINWNKRELGRLVRGVI